LSPFRCLSVCITGCIPLIFLIIILVRRGIIVIASGSLDFLALESSHLAGKGVLLWVRNVILVVLNNFHRCINLELSGADRNNMVSSTTGYSRVHIQAYHHREINAASEI
jgi:hypothetical protein